MEHESKKSYIKRNISAIEPWKETCGNIRPLIEEKDGTGAEMHYVEIKDAKLHYHNHTDEFYYVVEGNGSMIIDGEEVPVSKGDAIHIPRGAAHKAVGNISVLVICVPQGVMNDIHELE